jgi:hypothetical protein
MDRPKGFEEHRFLGDKRTQVVYDLDHCDREDLVGDVVAAGAGATFGPDTLAEARNRGYRLSRHSRPSGDG